MLSHNASFAKSAIDKLLISLSIKPNNDVLNSSKTDNILINKAIPPIHNYYNIKKDLPKW